MRENLLLTSQNCLLFCACFNCRQLFALYDTLPEPSVKKMEDVVNIGINIVASVYFLVGHRYLVKLLSFLKTGFTSTLLAIFSSQINKHQELPL